MAITLGVLALQGAFLEHVNLLRQAIDWCRTHPTTAATTATTATATPAHGDYDLLEVRTPAQLQRCDALIIPGGESTTIALVAARGGLLEPLRHFVKVDRKPVWGTCAGLILLAESANATKKGGQDLIGGLDVRVNRNHFGRQIESFVADLHLPFLPDPAPFPGVFIRAPIVEKLLPHVDGVQREEQARTDTVVAPARAATTEVAKSAMGGQVQVLGVLPGRTTKAAESGVTVEAGDDAGDIIAVKQGNVFGTSFHPELTSDIRIHVWWINQVSHAYAQRTSWEPMPDVA